MPIIDEIRDHLSESSFQPFALRTADGREYPVPTLDHIWLPGGRSIVVSNDRGITVRLAPLLIAGIVFDLPPSRRGRTGRRKS